MGGCPPVEQNQASVPRLYIANVGESESMTSYANPSTVNGNIAPSTNLAGAQTQLDAPVDIVVNSANRLLVVNIVGNSITAYDDAEQANGNQAPDGTVIGAATELGDPESLAVNTAEDAVFVAQSAPENILVFSGIATGAFNSNLAPLRTIVSADLDFPVAINFGANDDLYVANAGDSANVVVFANASSLNGAVGATRVITSMEFTVLFDVFIDGNDTMFVVDIEDNQIYIFENAATLNGLVIPDFTLTVPQAAQLSAIVVDSNDTGYIADFGANAVYSYDNISTRNGTINPNRTISGDQTQLDDPYRMFLSE